MFPPEPPSDNPPSDTYNGWPNKPTWAVFTWLTNTESTLSEIGELLSTASDPGSALRTWCEDYELWLGPFEVPCLGRDLIDWVIAVIDWDHAARALKEAAGH